MTRTGGIFRNSIPLERAAEILGTTVELIHKIIARPEFDHTGLQTSDGATWVTAVAIDRLDQILSEKEN